MRKSVLIGGGLGLLVLVLVAVSYWLADYNAHKDLGFPNRVASGYRFTPPALSGLPAPTGVAAPALPRSSQTSQERRRRLAEVRAEFNALRVQGANASPERMRAVVDELEALSPPGFDPRYYQALRNMLDASARVQVLNKELQALTKSTSPNDLARQKAIADEMRTLGERVGAEARNLQAYAPKAPSGVKTP